MYFFKDIETILLLSKIDYRLRYHENQLGVFWALLRPIIEVLVYFFAFKFVLHNTAPNFLVFLFLGQVSWLFFVELGQGMINLLETKRFLYEYSQLSKVHIYLAYLLTILRGFGLNLSLVFLLALLHGIEFSWHLLWLPLVLGIYLLFFLGLGVLLSILYLFLRDVTQLWSIGVFGLYWLTPIILPSSAYLEKAPWLVWINPLFGFIENMRFIILRQSAPDFVWLLAHGLIGGLFLLLALWALKVWGPKASELL